MAIDDDPSAASPSADHGSPFSEASADDQSAQTPDLAFPASFHEECAAGSEGFLNDDPQAADAVRSGVESDTNLLCHDIMMQIISTCDDSLACQDVTIQSSVKSDDDSACHDIMCQSSDKYSDNLLCHDAIIQSSDMVSRDIMRNEFVGTEGSVRESDSKLRECADAVGASCNEAQFGDSGSEFNIIKPEFCEDSRVSSRHDNIVEDTVLLADRVHATEAMSREVPELEDVSEYALANGKGAGTEELPSLFSNGTESERSLMDLPADLRKNTTVLNCTWDSPEETCSIYIVGTAHVSKESCKEVQAVIHHLKPQVVFLELCANRVAILTPQNLKVPTVRDMLEMWREKRMNPFGILYSWFLAKVANKLEVFPGAEFRVAYEEALACGAKVTLGDRPVQITLRRTWARMSIWHKIKLIFALSTQAFFLPSVEDINRMLEEMSDSDMITLLIQEMSKSFPTLMETLVDERDLFMTAILQKVARHHSSIVVVVGKGHMPGIIRNWGKDIKIDSLLEIPQRSSRSLYLKRWGTVALAIGGLAIISGIYFSKKR